MNNFHAKLAVTFFSVKDGGKEKPTQGEWYACPLIFPNGKALDCRLYLEGRRFMPGDEGDLYVKFLDYENAVSLLSVGQLLQLWDGGVVGRARVIEIY